MIIGLGNDLVNIERIEKLLKKFGKKFEQRYFREEENFETYLKNKNSNREFGKEFIDSKDKIQMKACYYAKRFAAKEAFVKALGTGFRNAVSFKDIFLVNNYLGKPEIMTSGKAEDILKQLSEGRKIFKHVSLTDDYPAASAVVILESL